ncbi:MULTISPECIES: ECF transporter S component [unclassified Cryobacterium]|uniref:ECF transporter S component n=1 Tax=unclassified Cryobacterium TaxID=2649013 RepID=UPI001F542060|nr:MULTISPECIES: ECF transporter S component [unclassified Cryobacterium]
MITGSRALPVPPRTALALMLASLVGILAFGWPLFAGRGTILERNASAPLILGAVLVGVMATVLVALGDGGIDVKAIAILGLLSGVGADLRPLSAGSAGIEFVFFFIILGGRVFGPGFGFALGSTTLFASALLTGGVGPWLPFQMLAASWIGMGAGLLPARVRGRTEIVVLAFYAALCGFVYGQAMNLSFWPFTLGPDTALSFVPGAPLGETLTTFFRFSIATSFGWDLMRAIVLAGGVALIGWPVLAALRRTARRAFFSAALPARDTPEPKPKKQNHYM